MEKTHILLVEPNESQVQLFTSALTESSISFLCNRARNMEEALKILKNVVPDIIFIDENMPGVRGINYLKEIKTINCLKEIPVVLYSSVSQLALKQFDAFTYMFLPGSVYSMAECNHIVKVS